MAELRVALHAGQVAIHNSPANNKVVAAGRRFGKTHLAAAELLIAALANEHNGHPLTEGNEVYYITPTFAQGKRAMWPKLKQMGRFASEGGVIAKVHENDGIFTLINGRRISVKGADDPDSLRGVGLHYVVLDEYADMKPQVWDEIIQPALMDVGGNAMFIGTPKGKNHFYSLFMNALDHAPGFEDWEAFSFSSMDNPTLSDIARKKLYNNPNYSTELRQQELEASFITRGGGALKEEWWQFSQNEPGDGYFVVVVDLAGFRTQEAGKPKMRTDETAISVVKITKRGWWVKEIIHGQWDTRETALKIILAARGCQASRIGIEKTSLMHAVLPYLEDVMRQYSQWFNIEPLSHGNQRKEERVLWSLQGRLERGRIILNSDPNVDYFDRPLWIRRLIEQANDFPSTLTKDDLIDSLSYTDQMGSTIFADDLVGADEWQPLDQDAGY